MSAICPICESNHRHSIETAMLDGKPIEQVYMNYKQSIPKLTMDQLKIHAVCHFKTPVSDNGESIATKLAFSEAQTLTTSCNEYMATLQRLGQVIDKKLTDVENGDSTAQQALSKSLVDLYLGTGNQIRETVKLLTDAYKDMNAEDSDSRNKSGLKMLSGALDRSRQKFGSVG